LHPLFFGGLFPAGIYSSLIPPRKRREVRVRPPPPSPQTTFFSSLCRRGEKAVSFPLRGSRPPRKEGRISPPFFLASFLFARKEADFSSFPSLLFFSLLRMKLENKGKPFFFSSGSVSKGVCSLSSPCTLGFVSPPFFERVQIVVVELSFPSFLSCGLTFSSPSTMKHGSLVFFSLVTATPFSLLISET